MIDNLVYVAKVLLPGLILSIVTAILTVRLSLRRFYAERWWDKKIEAYTSIFEALYRLKHYCNIKYKQDCDLRSAPISKEQEKELEKQWADADMEIGKTIDIGSFVICDDAVSCLIDFRKRPRLDFEANPIFELAAQESKYLDECISRLKMIAKQDLKLKGRNNIESIISSFR
jgi:hypothetical protein